MDGRDSLERGLAARPIMLQVKVGFEIFKVAQWESRLGAD